MWAKQLVPSSKIGASKVRGGGPPCQRPNNPRGYPSGCHTIKPPLRRGACACMRKVRTLRLHRSRATKGSCPVGGEATLLFVKTWRELQPAPHTLTAAQSHPRPPCDVPRTLAASAKLAAQSWRSSRNCRTSDRRKHVQPSFHLRDDDDEGDGEEADDE